MGVESLAGPQVSIDQVATTSRLRCISCGATPESAVQNFRCANCGDLLEFFFPEWNLDAATLKSLWLSRRASRKTLDQSGVWRFRELLPNIPEEHAITLREGNTPLYDLPGCARLAARARDRSATGAIRAGC